VRICWVWLLLPGKEKNKMEFQVMLQAGIFVAMKTALIIMLVKTSKFIRK
jgi:hypothetical protein